MNSNPYYYMNESVIQKTVQDFTNLKKRMNRTMNKNHTFLFVGSIKLKMYKQEIKMHEERWRKMEEFRNSELKRELMEKIFHPNNVHKFIDWGFIDNYGLHI